MTPKHKQLDLVFFARISKEESSGSEIFRFQWEVGEGRNNAKEVDLEETSGRGLRKTKMLYIFGLLSMLLLNDIETLGMHETSWGLPIENLEIWGVSMTIWIDESYMIGSIQIFLLKDNIKRYVELDTYFAKSTKRCSILASYPLLKEKICDILKKQMIVGQPLYGVCI